jgi:hypothetical protein
MRPALDRISAGYHAVLVILQIKSADAIELISTFHRLKN